MAKLIKRSSVDDGDVSPDTGFVDDPGAGRKVISGKKYEAKAEAKDIVAKAKADAQRIVGEAREQAAGLITEAQAEGEQIKADAKTGGYQEGREQGATELAEIVAGASQRLSQIEAQAVPQLKELAVTIARKILGKELEFHPDGVVDIVKQALGEKARQRREIFLRVNPEDMTAIRESKPDLLEVLSRCKEIGIREDPDVERFGVVIETDAGMIDAQLETQLAVFERVLKNS